MSEGADGSRSAADGRTPNVLQWFGVFAQSVAVLVFLGAVYDAVHHQDWPRALRSGAQPRASRSRWPRSLSGAVASAASRPTTPARPSGPRSAWTYSARR
jgi:hypothetical protein